MILSPDTKIKDCQLDSDKPRKHVFIIIKKWNIKKMQVTDNELNEPMVMYLIRNNIPRSCFQITTNGHVDVNKPFINYLNKENKLEFYPHHITGCAGTNCDLVKIIKHPLNYYITERTKNCEVIINLFGTRT